MTGVLYIDGVDVYSAFGVSLSDVAYDELVCLPRLKDVPFNDWHEKNGIEPDLSAPVVEARDIIIPFHISDVQDGYNAFISAITDGAYHLFNFAKIGLSRMLRLKSCGDISSICGLGSFVLTFSDDDPIEGHEASEPSSSMVKYGDFLLDGVDMASYGIRILRGTMDSVMRMPEVKENLKRDISVSNGVSYDGAKVTFKSRTAQLTCLMKAASANEFWNNRNALLNALIKPGSRILTIDSLGKDIPCYYKESSVRCFFPDRGNIWFEFTLDLEFYKGVI